MAKISLEKYFVGLGKDSLIYGLGNALLKVLALITAPIFTRIFVPAEYGIISLIASIISFLSLLLIFGMDSAIPVSFYEYKKERKIIISSGFWFLLVWGIILVGLGQVLAGKISFLVFHNSSYNVLLIIAFWTAFLTLLINLCKAVFRLEFRAKTFALIAGLQAILTVGLMILFVAYFRLSLTGYFLGGLLGAGASLILAISLIRNNLSLTLSWRRLKEMIVYGSMIVPASVAFFVFDLSDRFFLNHYRDLTELGLYSIGINIASLILFFSVAIGQAWSPFILKIYFQSKKIFHEFVPRTFTYYLIFFFVLAVGLTLFGEEILRIFTTEKFYPAARVIGPLALAMVFSASLQVTAMGISISRKTKYFALFSGLAAGLNIILNFFLIPRYGMVGAGFATAFSYLFLTIVYFFQSQRFIYLKIAWQKIFKLVLLAVSLILLLPFSWQFDFWGNLSLKIGEFLLFLVLLYFLGIIEKNELSYLKMTVLRFKSKKS
ncbi:MAG: flippase [Patescibacteria group bacterium]